jgi:hypothetical protein
MADESSEEGDAGLIIKLVVTAGVLFFAPWGLVFEPGPLSEMAVISILAGLWGLPYLDDLDEEDVSDEN